MIGRCRLGTYIYRSLRQWLLLSSLSFLLQSTVTKLRCSFLGMWLDLFVEEVIRHVIVW